MPQMGNAFIRGLQGDDLAEGVVATAKHFVGYGASEGGLNWAPAHLPSVSCATCTSGRSRRRSVTAGLRR